MYQLLLLGSPYFVKELTFLLQSKEITYLSDLDSVKSDFPLLCLYYGQNEKDAAFCDSRVDKYVKDMQVLPIVKDLNQFKKIIPEQLHTINGLELKDKTSLPELFNYILSYFGFINANRKVFISYKRDDTQRFAIQLFEALNFAGYQPFLDTSSIEKGKPFQEYLRHELSDSEMMLFLNSPNVKESNFVLEELDVASKVGVNIINVKFDECGVKQEAEISNSISIGKCNGKDSEYDKATIHSIMQQIEEFRSLAFEQKRLFLIQEITSRLSSRADRQEEGYLQFQHKAVFPWTHIPVSMDMESVEQKNIQGANEKQIVYNGMYCRPDIQEHLNWLNSKCSEVQAVDVKYLNFES